MEIALAVAAGLLLIATCVATAVAVRRGGRCRRLSEEAAAARRALQELEQRHEEKCRTLDDAQRKLAKTREEVGRARKKAFELEQQDKQPEATGNHDAERLQEEALQKARSEARRAGEEARQAADECTRLRDQVDRLKNELAATRDRQVERQRQEGEQEKTLQEQVDALTREKQDLERKLKSARRKARNDQQVYNVTRSKLELAMEKIAYLEQKAGPDKPSGA